MPQYNMERFSHRAPSKKLNILSQILLFPFISLCVLIYFLCRPFGIESIVSTFLFGGLFGLVVIPFLSTAGLVYILDKSGLVMPGMAELFLIYVILPFSVVYVVVNLIFDQTHLQVKDANPRVPNNQFERWYEEFAFSGLSYFDIKCVPWAPDAVLPTDRQYIFAIHPHGIHCTPILQFSTIGSAFDQRFPGLVGHKLTGLVATVMFKLPLIRELFLRGGYVDASRPVASQVLAHGRSLFVCTGGEEESMYAQMGRDIVVLQRRKGFVRLALTYGVDMVPVFGVGNNDLYITYNFLRKPRIWLQKNFGIALPIFRGGWFTPLPMKKPIQILIGKPLVVPRPKAVGERPDEKLVDEYHSKYIAALKELHKQHVSDRVLEIR